MGRKAIREYAVGQIYACFEIVGGGVIGGESSRPLWQCKCTVCGAFSLKKSGDLNTAVIRKTERCGACSMRGLKEYKTKQQTKAAPQSYDYKTPEGLLRQKFINGAYRCQTMS